jgi:hypothetical protein
MYSNQEREARKTKKTKYIQACTGENIMNYKTMITALITVMIVSSTGFTAKAENADTKPFYNVSHQSQNVYVDLQTKITEVEHLEKSSEILEKQIKQNQKEIDNLNQVVFFYSDHNITDIFKAVEEGKIQAVPVLKFPDTECGYPIYNTVQNKMGKLMKQNYIAQKKIEQNDTDIAKLQTAIKTLKQQLLESLPEISTEKQPPSLTNIANN